MARLFDESPRTNARASGQVEGRYRFLNRASGPVFDRIRGLLEDWLIAYPASEKADLIGRFRSGDVRVFLGAFWELYQAEALRRAGWNLTSHPHLPGSVRRPDFEARRSGAGFYLETTIATISDLEFAADKRRGKLYEAINSIPSPDFWLAVDIERAGDQEPKLRLLRQDVAGWLASLDYDAVLRWDEPNLIHPRHGFNWMHDGWHLSFRPLPKLSKGRGTTTTTVGTFPGSAAGYIDSLRPLRQALREKSSRYGDLDRSYVVAVLIDHWYVDEDDLIDALFGSVAVQISTSPTASPQTRSFRRRDGSWFRAAGPVGTRVSAVLVARNLGPSSVATVEPVVILNPWASRPLDVDLGWRALVPNRDTGTLAARPASTTAAALFSLARDWPGPEDPFPDD